MKTLTIIIFTLSSITTAWAQDSIAIKKNKSYSLALYYASVFAHSKSVQNTAGANPVGIELLSSSLRHDEKSWQLCNCFLNTGVGFHYFNFDNKILGHSFSLYYLLEPQFRLHKKLKLLTNTHSGIAYLSNPYHPSNNPNNMSYSTSISAYIGLGMGLQYSFRHWQWALMAHFLHVSNGGIKDPNKGINWPAISLRASYYPKFYPLPRYTSKKNTNLKQTLSSIELFISSKTVATGEKARYLVIGGNYQLSKQIGAINALTLASEIIFDYSLKEKLERDQLEKSYVRIGLALGHEFILGRFRFGQQLVFYPYSPSPYFSKIYHRWGINYQINRSLTVGFRLLAHKQVANFFDFRIGYIFAHHPNKHPQVWN
jgi:hypothetical protein